MNDETTLAYDPDRATAPQVTADAQPGWDGLRLQVHFTPGGAPHPAGAPVDATTTTQGHQWSRAVADRLRAAGHAVTQTTDDGEDAQGDLVTYDEVLVEVGGHPSLSLSFFTDLIFWVVDMTPEEASREAFTRVARDVIRAVGDVCGCFIDPARLGSYEQRILAVPAPPSGA